MLPTFWSLRSASGVGPREGLTGGQQDQDPACPCSALYSLQLLKHIGRGFPDTSSEGAAAPVEKQAPPDPRFGAASAEPPT